MLVLREYYRPASAGEAVDIKHQYRDRARYLAGGSDLMVDRPSGVDVMIDIRHCGMGYIREEAGESVIGGAALLRDAEAGLASMAGGMVRAAIRDTAPWLIRNAATVAGNVANASPAADSVPALLALDAQVVLLGEATERLMISDVLQGPHQTSLGDRLITEIRLPAASMDCRGAFIKLARSKSDIAQVNVAVTFALDGQVLRDVRVALGAVAPTAIRLSVAESVLEGHAVTDELLEEVERVASEEVRPIGDWRASQDYRRRMSGVLVRRAIRRALSDAGNGDVV